MSAAPCIFDAHETGVFARVRLGRHGRTAVEWEPDAVYPLYLQKDPKGRTCVVALQGRGDFAEFDPRHDTESEREFVTEDYVMEVLELPASAPA